VSFAYVLEEGRGLGEGPGCGWKLWGLSGPKASSVIPIVKRITPDSSHMGWAASAESPPTWVMMFTSSSKISLVANAVPPWLTKWSENAQHHSCHSNTSGSQSKDTRA
jgi:hypothetical protein